MELRVFVFFFVSCTAFHRALAQVVITDGNSVPSAAEKVFAYEPFEFAYRSNDGLGTTQHRQEVSDANGVVKGVYGYIDPRGLYRTVEYTADTNGYRAVIKTNEPGTSNQNAADAVFIVQPAPAGLTDLPATNAAISDSAPSANKPAISILNPRASPSTVFSVPVPVAPNVVQYPMYQRPTAVYGNPVQILPQPLQALLRRRADYFTPRSSSGTIFRNA